MYIDLHVEQITKLPVILIYLKPKLHKLHIYMYWCRFIPKHNSIWGVTGREKFDLAQQ